jgi:hypothetical protein
VPIVNKNNQSKIKQSLRGYEHVMQGITTLTFTALMSFTSTAIATTEPICSSPKPGAPLFITARCTDPHFTQPYIDIDEQRSTPVPHHYIHGGFTGTDTRFSFYFPSADQYKGRFFQGTHQLITNENNIGLFGSSPIEFAFASGGYYVLTNIGGNETPRTAEQATSGNYDPSIGGYRANAAAAKYSRVVAAQLFGDQRIYGYLSGGSGGAYQVIASSENTTVWDGYVPFVMGTPNSIPGVFTARIHALRVLKQRNKFPEVLDVIDPGGSGNPYATWDFRRAVGGITPR